MFRIYNSITVVNDTQHEWQCNINSDVSTLLAGTLIAAAAASTLGLVGSTATYGPHLYGKPIALTLKYWFRFAAIAGTVGGAVAGAGSLALMLKQSAAKELADKGYVFIEPNSDHTWHQVKPFLLREIDCIRGYIVENHLIRQERIVMKHVYPGGLFVRDRRFSLAEWLRKHPVEVEDIVATIESVDVHPEKSDGSLGKKSDDNHLDHVSPGDMRLRMDNGKIRTSL